MTFFDDLQWRGLVHQTTDEKLGEWLAERPRTVYAGFDPTADSLHVGSLLGLIVLRRFQQAGHTPIAVVGGATGMIGDPSGKSAERNLLSKEDLQHNVDGLAEQMQRFLDFETTENPAQLVNNFDWTGPWSYLEFLRDVGKNFPVNVMLGKDSVKSRLGGDSGMSYTEFSYMLLQAYDFVHLFNQHDCELQAGGSDQWGNITAGIDLGRRMHGAQLYGCTWPLLTKSDGTKMGKTESGAIWLSADRTSPYDFYQYWFGTDDADVGNCLRMLTELSHEEIEALDASRQADAAKRESQRRLAEELTKLVHGEEALAAAQEATKKLFSTSLNELSDAELVESLGDVPSRSLPMTKLTDDGLTVVDAFVEAGLTKSKSDARRLVQGNGAYINNQPVSDPLQPLGADHLATDTVMVLRSGKKKYALLRFEG